MQIKEKPEAEFNSSTRMGIVSKLAPETPTLVHLCPRSVVLIGMMGCGKSTTGKRLSQILRLEFVDVDREIEKAADMSIADIFSRYGEEYFRNGERRVMSRLLEGGPRVIATGGGTYLDPETRQEIEKKAVSVWLKVDFAILLARVMRRHHRPLLQNEQPERVLHKLIDERYPIYAQAAFTIAPANLSQDQIVQKICAALKEKFI